MGTIVFILILLALALVYSGWIGILYFNQRRMQYFPTHRDAHAKGDSVFKPWRNASGDFLGYARSVDRPNRAIVFLHGNAGEALDRVWIADLAPEDDFLLFLIEYPGYGARTGSPSEEAINKSVVEAIELIAREWKVPITVVGESLGTAAACHVAALRSNGSGPIDRLGLISPFTSATEIAARAYPYVPVRLLHRDRMDAMTPVRGLKIPIHVIHGTLDEVVPITEGRKLLDASPSSVKTLTEVPGYGHSNINMAIVDSPFADNFRAFVRGE
jgi:uncharacterized protein